MMMNGQISIGPKTSDKFVSITNELIYFTPTLPSPLEGEGRVGVMSLYLLRLY
jgi:hypothetical protein